jgi:hypothetical protein
LDRYRPRIDGETCGATIAGVNFLKYLDPRFCKYEAFVRTVLIILGMLLLLNVLFVVVMSPPRKPRKSNAPRCSDVKLTPATINKESYPFDAEEKTSVSVVVVSVAMGTFFVLALPIAEAVDAIRSAFKTRPPAE